MFSLEELIAKSQQTDLEQETERIKKERADRKALQAKARAGTFTISELLHKISGEEQKPVDPASETQPPVKVKVNVPGEERFPAPPSLKRGS